MKLLRCESSRMALRVRSLRRTDSVVIEGIADIRRGLAARRNDANDLSATWAVQDFRSAKALFVPC
jgi:hypothetical protein